MEPAVYCQTIKRFDVTTSTSPRTILCGNPAKRYRLPQTLHEIHVCDDCFITNAKYRNAVRL